MSLYDIQSSGMPVKNSTNDHAISLPFPAYIRLPFQIVSGVSPRLGGEIGRQLFFTPPRSTCTDLQRQMLDHADIQVLRVSGQNVVTYSWGSGPVVLLVHGWGGHSGQMSEFVTPLVDMGFRAIAVDMPAHGRSEGRMSSLIHFSGAIMSAAWEFGRVHGVITHSLGAGGLVRALLDGVLMRRAVLIAPQAQFNDYWRMFRQGLGMTDKVWAATVAASERWLGVSMAEVHPAVGAPKMTVPALIVHGQRDRISPLTEGRRLAKLWPASQLVELDAGHLSILRDEKAVRAATAFMLRSAELRSE